MAGYWSQSIFFLHFMGRDPGRGTAIIMVYILGTVCATVKGITMVFKQ